MLGLFNDFIYININIFNKGTYMKTLILFLWRLLLSLMVVVPLFFITCERLDASEIKVRELSLELGKYTSTASRDVYLDTPNTGPLATRVNLNWNLDLACGYYPSICLYWDNKIHSKTSEDRFRYVGWEFSAGLDFGRLQIYYNHFSQHMLEQIPEGFEKKGAHVFPVEDIVMARFVFIGKAR